MSGLEAAQQLVQSVQHLLGEAFAHLVLELAAVVQQRGEALVGRHAQQTGLAEQFAHRGADRPAGGLEHVDDVEVQPA